MDPNNSNNNQQDSSNNLNSPLSPPDPSLPPTPSTPNGLPPAPDLSFSSALPPIPNQDMQFSQPTSSSLPGDQNNPLGGMPSFGSVPGDPSTLNSPQSMQMPSLTVDQNTPVNTSPVSQPWSDTPLTPPTESVSSPGFQTPLVPEPLSANSTGMDTSTPVPTFVPPVINGGNIGGMPSVGIPANSSTVASTMGGSDNINGVPQNNMWPNAPQEPMSAGLPLAGSNTNLNMGGSDQTVRQPMEENAPTDLSHLVENLTGGDSSNVAAQPFQPESFTTPQAQPQAAAPTVNVAAPSRFPKWIFLVGGLVLILLVIGVSAFVILGVGQTQTPQTSVPAEQEPLTNPPRSLIPSPVETTETSTSLGTLTNSSGAGTLSPSPEVGAATPTGTTSAIELLRRRQTQ